MISVLQGVSIWFLVCLMDGRVEGACQNRNCKNLMTANNSTCSSAKYFFRAKNNHLNVPIWFQMHGRPVQMIVNAMG
jgi:hypothetical protein